MENEIKKENEVQEVTNENVEPKIEEPKVEELKKVEVEVEDANKKVAIGTELPSEIQEVLDKVDGSESKDVDVKVPKLFVSDEDNINVEVDVIFNAKTGDILSVVVAEVELDVEKIKSVFGYERYKFVFSRPTYDKLNRYRQRSMEYDAISKVNTINQLKLRDFFIVYHLKEWNIKDENGKGIGLQFEPNGSLVDDTIDIVYGLHPSILDVVITSFERKMLLVG